MCFAGGKTTTSAICTVCVLQVEPDGKRYTINHRHVSYLHCVCITGGTTTTSAICTVCVLQVEQPPRQLSAPCVFYRWNQTASVTPSTTATSAICTVCVLQVEPDGKRYTINHRHVSYLHCVCFAGGTRRQALHHQPPPRQLSALCVYYRWNQTASVTPSTTATSAICTVCVLQVEPDGKRYTINHRHVSYLHCVCITGGTRRQALHHQPPPRQLSALCVYYRWNQTASVTPSTTATSAICTVCVLQVEPDGKRYTINHRHVSYLHCVCITGGTRRQALHHQPPPRQLSALCVYYRWNQTASVTPSTTATSAICTVCVLQVEPDGKRYTINHRHVSYLHCVCFTGGTRRQALHHQPPPRQLSALCVFYRWNQTASVTPSTTATSAICTVCVLQVEPDGKRYTINHRHVSYLHCVCITGGTRRQALHHQPPPRQLSALCVFYRWNQTASVTPSTTATSAICTVCVLQVEPDGKRYTINHRHVSYLHCVCFTGGTRRQALHHQPPPRQLSALCVFYRWNQTASVTPSTTATSAICTVCVLQVEPDGKRYTINHRHVSYLQCVCFTGGTRRQALHHQPPPRQLSALCVYYRWNQTASVTPSTTATSAICTVCVLQVEPDGKRYTINHRHVSYLHCVCITGGTRRQALHHQPPPRQLSALCVFYRWNQTASVTPSTTATSAICTVCVLQVEPDGKRYTINHRHVSYLHWDFHIRLSSLTGPQIYDVRYQGDRIAYELGLSEIAVFYSGDSPVSKVTDFVDSASLIGGLFLCASLSVKNEN